MTPTMVLLNIIGGIAMLLYGLRQIKRGIMRGFGASLRGFVSVCTANRLTGFFAGLLTTMVLQSGMAVMMILTTFLSQKMLTISAALAVVLGAEVGVTLIAQILTLNLAWLSPLLLVVGLVLITSFETKKKIQNIGLTVFGLGLMLMAVGIIREASIPFKTSEALPYLLRPLDIDPVMTMMVAALLTWLFHSTLAFIMLTVSFATAGVISPHLALLLVLGANVGNVIAPLMATMRDEPAALRLPVANMLMRITLAICLMPFISEIVDLIQKIDSSTARQVVHFHFAFNLLLAIVFLPLTGVVARIVTRLVPDRVTSNQEVTPLYLDIKQMDTPVVALSAAARETLRVADVVQDMLVKTLEVFQNGNEQMIRKIKEKDTVVDMLHHAIKHYMAKAMELSLDSKEARRHLQIINFATTLEHIGDTIDKSMMPMAERMVKNHRRFSEAGMREIEELFRMVINSVHLAQTVFMSSDQALARKLVEGKEDVVRAERRASASHFARLSQGVPESIETSSIHLDILRDLQRINGDVVTVAYPILEETGELLPNRLTRPRMMSLEPDVMSEV